MKRHFALALAAAMTLAACGAPTPPPVRVPAPQAAPWTSLDASRLAAVISETTSQLAAADAARSVDPMAARVTGLAARLRAAQYALANASQDAAYIKPMAVDAVAKFVTATTSFPRTAVVVTSPQTDALPLILAFVQNDARSNFQLVNYTRLLPGVQLPAMKTFEDGSAPVFADTTALVASPPDILNQYADLLNNGEKSAHVAAFSDDAFQQQVKAARQRVVDSVKDLGKVEETFTPVADSMALISTFDGGALLFAGFTSTTTITLSGSTITLGPLEAKLAGAKSYGSTMTRTQLESVVFYVPPAATGGLIKLIGAEQVLTEVTGG